MRVITKATGSVAFLILAQVAAPAAAQLSFGLPEVKTTHDSDPVWMTCYTWDRLKNTTYVSGIYQTTRGESSGSDGGWRDYVQKKTDSPKDELIGGCNQESSLKDAQWRNGEFWKGTSRHVAESAWKPTFKNSNSPVNAKLSEQPKQEPSAPDAQKLKAEREAAWQTKVKAYEAAKAKQEAEVTAYERAKLELEQKKQEQRLAVEKAAEEFRKLAAAHERDMQERERQAKLAEAEYRRQLQEYASGNKRSAYRAIPVMGNSGATRGEAEQKFLDEMNRRYGERSNLQYQCVDLMGRWVCNGTVEFGTRPAKQAVRDDAPAKASSQ